MHTRQESLLQTLFALLMLLCCSHTLANKAFISEMIPVPIYANPSELNSPPNSKLTAESIGEITPGSNVTILDENSIWTKIETANSLVGWIKTHFISDQPTRLNMIQDLQQSVQKLNAQLTNKRGEINYISNQFQLCRDDLNDQNRLNIELHNRMDSLLDTNSEELQNRVNILTSQLEFKDINHQIRLQAQRSTFEERNQTLVTLSVIFCLVSFFCGILVQGWVNRKKRYF